MKNGESAKTTDHETIIKWAESRGGKPAKVRGADNKSSALIRLHFGGNQENNLEEISWDEFFDAFEKSQLALLYQEKTSDGKESRFSKLIHR